MSTTTADTELARLTSAVAAIATNLVELDQNPDRQELGRITLTGRTATAWADASDALERLWQGHRQLTEVITRAEALRGQRRMNDADRDAYRHQVLGPSITLSTATVPLAQRGLLGAGQVVATCTPAELLSAMESSFRTAVAVVSGAGEAWRRGVPAAAEAADTLQRVRDLTRQAGAGAADRLLDEADRLLGGITRVLLSDPLGADLTGLADVRSLVDRADAERTSAAELQASLAQRLRDARVLLADLDAAQRAAGETSDAAAGRFPDDQIIAVRMTDPRPELAAIDALAAAGHWALISPRLSAWRRQATDRLAALRDASARNAALLTERNELRGRLDAYRAKALRRGLGEDPVLGPLAEAARDRLHQAPCDLPAARSAVDAYQDALSATIAAREAR
ncbi:hypothetical protein [Actinoplanes derwentensis]|uniref:Uncharacterized protein n=1 Tax=Actinoplanes derwentensis TaxID=113562 RepID=A0A1H1Q8P9_9ACTN|nr:hypothetical protein [Actinoplanes derwentensis]GID82204.1 hypothetical protein Ade03nite_11280 [Actinoplanes derwentensis]SDS19816.1 hypothetical protein SAMN04489716_0237 [Actinoplanes derwentensis]